MEALEAIDDFGAAHVAAAVIGGDGYLAIRGDTNWAFELASVTKLISAYATLIAIEEESIDLETPVGPVGSTVAHLLSHASGISFSEPNAVLAAPGTRRIYSNAGFEILSRAVGERTDMDFSTYVEDGVFSPLEMSSASISDSPATGARASIGDLVAFAAELIRPSLIGSQLWSKAMTTAFPGLSGVLPGFGYQDPCDWGLGFEIKGTKAPHWTGSRNSDRTFGHFGQSGTFLWVDPDIRFALIGLSDRAFGSWATDAWPKLSDAVLTELN